MQALKQAARENDETKLLALCEAWSLPAEAELENGAGQMNGKGQGNEPKTADGRASAGNREAGKDEGAEVNQGSGAVHL
jgi:hypothetical protein